jgi:hypothetical protein
MAEIEQAQKEYERAEAAFTHIAKGQIDPVQEVSQNPSEEMIRAQEHLAIARRHLERLQDEYEFYLSHQPGALEWPEPISSNRLG